MKKTFWYNIKTYLIYGFLPIALFNFILATSRYLRQRKRIFNLINTSDDLTNELYEHGFYDHTLKLPFKLPFIGDEIRTGILESFQLVEGAVTNISTGTQRVYIMQGINQMLREGQAYELARETSLKVIQPSSKVYIVDLIPSWLSSFRIAFNELVVSFSFSVCIAILYLILSFFVF